jgi:hypothetical protein
MPKALKCIYFFDDWLLEETRRLKRVFARAEQIPNGTWHDPAAATSSGASVFFDSVAGKYRLYYTLDRNDDNASEESLALAESDDGTHWRPYTAPPDLDKYSKEYPQIILTTPQGKIPATPFLDKHETDPVHRYKSSSAAGIIWTSPDGLRWTMLEDRPHWGIWHSDTHNQIWYNPDRRSWQLCFRPESGDRRSFVSESPDLKNWSLPVCAIMPGPQDPVGTEFYYLAVFPFDDIYIGLTGYCQFAPNIGAGVVWRIGGTVTPELVYSYDGIGWIRTRWRETVSMGRLGELGEGGVYALNAFTDPKDPSIIRIYSNTSYGEHSNQPYPVEIPDQRRIWEHRLRADGWVCLKCIGDVAYLRTRPMQTASGEMSLNIICPKGYARVQISDLDGNAYPGFSFDDCEQIRGDHLRAIPHWRGKENFAELKGKIVKVEIELFAAELYCIPGDWLHYTDG